MPIRLSLLAAFLAFAGPAAAQEATSHPVVPGYERFGSADGVEAGRLLLGELNCVTCHKPDAAVAEHVSAKKAPLLADAGSRYTYGWIRGFIADPQKLKPGATMPQPSLLPAEFDALAHYLMSLKRAKPIESAGGAPAKAKELFNRGGCAACHSPLDGPPREGAVPLPDLKAKYSNPAALAHFLFDPLSVRPSGRMPKLGLTQAEAMSIAAHFVGLPPRAPENPEDTAPGLAFDVYDGGFNKVPDFDGLKAMASGVTTKIEPRVAKKEENFAIRFRGYIEVPADATYTFATHSDDGSMLRIGDRIVVNNDGIHGGTEVSGSIALKAGRHAFSVGFIQGGGGAELKVTCEGPGIPKREIPVQAFSHPKSGAPVIREGSPEATFVPDPALVEKGRELFTSKRCATCHEGVPGQKPLEFKPLAQIAGAGGCLTGKPANFSLTAGQVEVLTAAIRELKTLPKPTPAQRIQRTMTALHCYACHERDRRGGPTVATDPLFITTGDDMGDEGRIPPHLTGVGGKLKLTWLQQVLANGSKVRPYMVTRMPVFGASNVGTLAADLEAVDAPAPAPATVRELPIVNAGRLLTGTKGMSCVTCHQFQNHKSLGIPGMDLVNMAQRLRRDWFGKYLLDPPSLRPGTRMPTYWPEGKSVRKDILDGNTEKQIEALWQFLSEGGNARLPIGIGPQPIPLVPVDEAMIYRNFIQGAGPRAIAVGYPEKAHLAFDSLQMRPALLWRGDFIDASKHWLDRGAGFQGPAGEDVVSLADGAPFAVLADPAAAWPKAYGPAAGYQFGGYELDKKRRPTFLYSFDKVEVRDYFEVVEGKTPTFKRTLTLESKEPPANLWFRVGAGKNDKLKIGLANAVSGADLRAPVEFKDGKATIEVSYGW